MFVMQIQRVFFSFRKTILSRNLHFSRNNLFRGFSTQENPEPHQNSNCEDTSLPVQIRMEIADKPMRELSEFIRATHGKLRNEYRKVQDPEAAWSVHSNNKEELQRYAAAMHRLAEHWETRFEDKDCVSRINWCYEALQTYFRKGDLEKTRDKELRTVSFHLPNLLGPEDTPNDTAIAPDAATTGQTDIKSTSKESSLLSTDGSKTIVYGARLKVLDVGSCYNPFSRYSDLDVTALDLQPATEDVYQCDFLKLNVAHSGTSCNSVSSICSAERTSETASSDKETAASTSKTITILPANSFDAVLFSFLLSYIPSPELRLRCCKNAYSLLKPEGALVIAAADSRGLINNVYIYKCWQITMASLGFVRVKYEKFKDFHGMVFRKGMYQEVTQIYADRELEKMKAKKLETELARASAKDIRKWVSRRERHIESFDLDKAFLGLWLPHDFRDSKEEEQVLEASKPRAKRKRESSPVRSALDHEDDGSASKSSKTDCSSQGQNPGTEKVPCSSDERNLETEQSDLCSSEERNVEC